VPGLTKQTRQTGGGGEKGAKHRRHEGIQGLVCTQRCMQSRSKSIKVFLASTNHGEPLLNTTDTDTPRLEGSIAVGGRR